LRLAPHQVGAFTIGLGLTNQHTLIFYALPLVAWIISLEPRRLLSAAGDEHLEVVIRPQN
jgi:hypothetical protein